MRGRSSPCQLLCLDSSWVGSLLWDVRQGALLPGAQGRILLFGTLVVIASPLWPWPSPGPCPRRLNDQVVLFSAHLGWT